MLYLTTFHPVDGNPSAESVVDSTGASKRVIRGCVVTEAQALSLANHRSNNAQVAQAAMANTVQPSSAQLTGLLTYLAKIQAGTNTAGAETAIALL
jgi:hypothetical protein